MREQSKLKDEGKPPGEKRLAPEPSRHTRRMVWIRQAEVQMQRMICDEEVVRDYITAPLQEISETGYWSRKVAQRMETILRAVATRATPGCFLRHSLRW